MLFRIFIFSSYLLHLLVTVKDTLKFCYFIYLLHIFYILRCLKLIYSLDELIEPYIVTWHTSLHLLKLFALNVIRY